MYVDQLGRLRKVHDKRLSLGRPVLIQDVVEKHNLADGQLILDGWLKYKLAFASLPGATPRARW